MIKKTITYEDFDGNKLVEDHWFHLSLKEVAELEATPDGGLMTFLVMVVQKQDTLKALDRFLNIIGKSYGVREGPTGFNKDPDVTQTFMKSPAFDAMFAEMSGDEKKLTEFVNGLFPKEFREKIAAVQPNSDLREILPKELLDQVTRLPDSEQKVQKAPWDGRDPTDHELMTMSREDLMEAMKQKMQRASAKQALLGEDSSGGPVT
jgi:hypothetical protein